MVERERKEASKQILCPKIWVDVLSTKITGSDWQLHFQGVDFQRVHLVDGLSTGLGLNGGGVSDVRQAITKATGSKGDLNDEGNVILVLDGLDFLLAATGCEVLGLLNMVGELREVWALSSKS